MSDADPAVHEALRWLQFSSEDMEVAQQLIVKTPPAPRHACWLSQQAAEKALKAALVSEGKGVPRTHDLDALRSKLPEGWAVRDTHDDLTELTE